MKLYLAGPQVFLPDAAAHFDRARSLCAAHGHEALTPLDGTAQGAAAIYAANLALIHAADAVLASLDPFRGFEPDSGTVFEVGYATALGKPVIGYVRDARSLRQRLTPEGNTHDADGLQVEDFDLPLNLMLAVPCRIVEGALAEAIAALDTRHNEEKSA
ncbi:nucleoside 2-deoxyribosyltransferase [Niveibacterium sp. SC-1]|uniref:nucleoside 2-deoxyribosyltransferase n=1 Tax=Niveibacterium sp. SC-1 TaxID=3135646 RepID=UPI00311DE5A4